eukprot:s483_g1.t1
MLSRVFASAFTCHWLRLFMYGQWCAGALCSNPGVAVTIGTVHDRTQGRVRMATSRAAGTDVSNSIPETSSSLEGYPCSLRPPPGLEHVTPVPPKGAGLGTLRTWAGGEDAKWLFFWGYY